MQGNIIQDSALTKKGARNGIIAALLLMFSWTGMGWNALGTYSVFVVEEFGCTTAQFATNFTILSLVNTILAITVYGSIMQKLGTRKVILYAGTLMTAGFVIFGLSHNIHTMWCGAFVFALGLAFANIGTFNVMVTAWFKKNTAKWTGFGQCFGPASGAFFNTIWGIVMVAVGFHIPFFISAAISAVATIVIYAIYREPHELGCPAKGELQLAAEMSEATGEKVEDILTGPTYSEAIRMPRTWLCFLGYALAGVCDYGILGNYGLVAAHYGFGEQVGFILGFTWLAQVFSFLILGWICDKWGSRYAVNFCFVLIIIVCLIFISGHVSLPIMYFCGALVGFADGAVQMPMGATAREVLGTRDFPKKMGLVGGGCFLGVTFAAVIVATIYDHAGSYVPAFIMLTVLSVVTAILFQFAAKKRY